MPQFGLGSKKNWNDICQTIKIKRLIYTKTRWKAVLSNDLEKVKSLLDLDPSTQEEVCHHTGDTPFLLALRLGHKRIAALYDLVDRGSYYVLYFPVPPSFPSSAPPSVIRAVTRPVTPRKSIYIFHTNTGSKDPVEVFVDSINNLSELY